jgi:hypothetical protein
VLICQRSFNAALVLGFEVSGFSAHICLHWRDDSRVKGDWQAGERGHAAAQRGMIKKRFKTMPSGTSADDLIKKAAAHNYKVKKRWLTDWHQSDLLPRPQHHFLEGVRGSVSLYPDGTFEQLLALCEIRAQVSHNLKRVGWLLWHQGFQVGTQYWRDPIDNALTGMQDIFSKITAKKDNKKKLWGTLSRFGEKLFKLSQTKRLINPASAFIRRQTGKNDFHFLISRIFEVCTGQFETSNKIELRDPAEAKRQREIFARVLGTQYPKSKRLKEPPKLATRVEANEFETMLQKLSPKLSEILNASKTFTISDQELIVIRYELKIIMSYFLKTTQIDMDKFGHIAKSGEIITTLARSLSTEKHAQLMILWSAARRIPSVKKGTMRILKLGYASKRAQYEGTVSH